MDPAFAINEVMIQSCYGAACMNKSAKYLKTASKILCNKNVQNCVHCVKELS